MISLKHCPKILLTLLVPLAMALFAASALAAPSVTGKFSVPGVEYANAKLTAGPDGNMWIARGKGVVRINAKTGATTPFDLGLTGALGITAAKNVTTSKVELWVVSDDAVTHFDSSNPADHETTTIFSPGLSSIVLGPDGNLWVATEEGLVRFPPANGTALSDHIDGVDLGKNFSPRDIDAAGQLLVVADQGGDRVLTATPAKALNGEFNEVKDVVNAHGVAGAPNGQIAFSAELKYGLFTPPAIPTQKPLVGAYGVTLGPDGAFWFAEAFGDENLLKVDSQGNETPFQLGVPVNSHPRQIAAGPENTVWVTVETPEEVWRISGVNPPTPPTGGGNPPKGNPPKGQQPETNLGKAPKGRLITRRIRATAKFQFSSPDAGAGFECRLVRKGAKAPGFAACTSPKSYTVKPGSYRFEVRAVLAGVSDRSPATRSFRVVRGL